MFIQKILREVNCPRCNAIAQERLEDRKAFVIIYLSCPKCHLEKNLGLTTRKALKIRKRQAKLRELADREKNLPIKNKLQKQIALLEDQIRKAEVI